MRGEPLGQVARHRAPVRKSSTVALCRSPSRDETAWREFQPLSALDQTRLSLEYHLQLEVMRAGAGSLTTLVRLMHVALASAVLQQLGYGSILPHQIEDYEAAAAKALHAGTDGAYRFGVEEYKMFAALLTCHDRQLQVAPLKALTYAENALEKYSQLN
jgi:hypothetical protein